MAPIEKKRPPQEAINKSRKRQRVAQHDCAAQERAGLGPKSLDALPWNEVALPERLDDAEGFFGLEEASDVDIVRDSNSGKVEYRVGEASWKPTEVAVAHMSRYPQANRTSNLEKKP